MAAARNEDWWQAWISVVSNDSPIIGLIDGYNGSRSNGTLRSTNKVLGDFGGGLEYRFSPHIGLFGETTYNVVDGSSNNFLQANSGLRFAF